jgi:hypothetical protein
MVCFSSLKQKNPKPSPRVLSSVFDLTKALHCTATLLLADSELTDHFLIAVDIVLSQVIEQTTPLADDFQ